MSSSEALSEKLRYHVIEMIHSANSSHVGSNLSIVDILAVLYSSVLKFNSNDPKMEERDRFFLSKGHATAVLYAVLAEMGFFAKKELETYYKNGSNLLGHAHYKVPGVELSTGSLGHALSVGTGAALAAIKQKKSHRIFVLLSDGECDEGSNWEAILFAAHHKLNNLFAIIDYNKIQSLNTIEKTLALEPFKEKWSSFGWEVIEVDGHNHEALKNAFSFGFKDAKPHVLIAHTVKGKGISFMENSVLWHYRSPQGEEYKKAIEELSNA